LIRAIMTLVACCAMLGCTLVVGTERRVVVDDGGDCGACITEAQCQSNCSSALSDCERQCEGRKDQCKLCQPAFQACDDKCVSAAR
jgi:hypothetical protein